MPDVLSHACGNLPVFQVSLVAFYCEHHQAWSVRAARLLEMADGDPKAVVDTATFGPFDEWTDVQRWLVERLAATPVAPGVPGAPLPAAWLA